MRGATETGGFVRRDIVALRYGTEYRRETVWRYVENTVKQTQ